VTTSDYYEVVPRLGNDGLTDILVYRSRPLLPDDGFGPGHIFYQRLINGVPEGDAVQVTDEIKKIWDYDTSGDYIVYSVYDEPPPTSIMLRARDGHYDKIYPQHTLSHHISISLSNSLSTQKNTKKHTRAITQ